MSYTLEIEPIALIDIQDAIDYYDNQQPGLGEKFEITINKHILNLGKNPFYQIRYDNIRCNPTNKFPFMIHYKVLDKHRLIRIVAVLHTSRSPQKWMKR